MDAHPTSENFQEACAAVDSLITARRFRAASRLAWTTLDTGEFGQFTQAQFLIALTSNLLNHHEDALAAHERARQCADFTDLWDGDFFRDHALWAIRNKKFAYANKFIEQARNLHAGDRSRLACLNAVEARLQGAQAKHDLALALHNAAERAWQELGDAAKGQWRFNNRFHWLRRFIAAGYGWRHPVVRDLERALAEEHHQYGARQHRIRRSLLRFGRLGYTLDEFVQGALQIMSRWH